MATIIDSLILELKLDPKNFTQGQKAAANALLNLRRDAGQAGKDVESAYTKTSQGLDRIKSEVISLGAALIGGRSLKSFVSYIVTGDAALGRLGYTMQENTKTLSTWRGVAEQSGGTAEGMTAFMNGLVKEFNHFQVTGESSFFPWLRGMGVQWADAAGNMRPVNDILLDINKSLTKQSPAKAREFISSIGGDQGVANTLLQRHDVLKKLIEDQQELGIATNKSADQAIKAEIAWTHLSQAATGLGRSLTLSVLPVLTEFLNFLNPATDWRAGSEKSRAAVQNKADEQHEDLRRRFGTPPDDWHRFFFDRKYYDEYMKGAHRGNDAQGTGSPAAPPRTLGGYAADLRAKPNAGDASPAVKSLAQSIQRDVPGLERFTAFNDQYHKGTRSKHARGLALDFTIRDPRNSADVAAQVRKKLEGMGVDARVIDEYLNPSRGSTGGHIHVQFNSADAAQRFSAAQASAGARNAAALGTGAAPAASASNVKTSTSTAETNINTINVQTQATDAEGIAAGIGGALKNVTAVATQANYGPN